MIILVFPDSVAQVRLEGVSSTSALPSSLYLEAFQGATEVLRELCWVATVPLRRAVGTGNGGADSSDAVVFHWQRRQQQ